MKFGGKDRARSVFLNPVWFCAILSTKVPLRRYLSEKNCGWQKKPSEGAAERLWQM